MTHLRTMMIEELVRRNYSENTRECYIRAVEEFALYFKCPPDRLGLEHIRIFQAHLFSDRKLSPNTVNQHLADLRFFFVKTLHRPWNTAETPYPKKMTTGIRPQRNAPRIYLLFFEHKCRYKLVAISIGALGGRRHRLAAV